MDFAKITANLEKHRFTVSRFATGNEAAEHLAAAIKGEEVGFGGSVTLQELGLYDRLAEHNRVYWHWVDPDERFRVGVFTIYLSSVNAIAETGEIVNIDGSGNRVAATIFGPKKVYFIAGKNKIRPDLATAIDRARNVASPLNAKRLERKTPCIVDGKCHDCNSPERICGVMAIHTRPMLSAAHTEVVLIDEEYGL